MPENNNNNQENKPIIEIPQEYYDKINKEQVERQRLEEEKQRQMEINKVSSGETKNLLGLSIINALIIFALLFAMSRFSEYIIFGLVAYILIGSFTMGKKYKKDSNFPSSILVGGIIVAIITFIASILDEANMDMWTQYAIVSGASAIIGVVTSSIITWMIYDKGNIKALQTIGVLLYFGLLIGGTYYLYNKYPEQFYKYVFMRESDVVATTEREFVEKTLKNRYNNSFTCNDGKRIMNTLGYLTIRHACTDDNDKEIVVDSIAYNESEILYVVQDNYMDVLLLNDFKEKIVDNLSSITGGSVSISLYPHKGCSFVGDCSDCDEYMAIYKEENDIKNQYNYSTTLNLENYKSMNDVNFVNEYEFKYIIDVSGRFGGLTDDAYASLVSKVLDKLNQESLKNTYGYEVTIKNSTEYNKVLYKVKGTTNENQDFSNPEVVK